MKQNQYLRQLPMLKKGGTVVTASAPVMPVSAMIGKSAYDADAIRIKQGSYDRLYYAVDPSDTTDIGKISWSAKGGVTVKNGVIYAKSISKTDKKTGSIKPAEVTLKCGKAKHTIKVVVQ